jgi:hypothetical protein
MNEKSTAGGDFGPRIAAAYASQGAAVELGRGMLGGTVHPDAVVRIPAAMCNRHGLIAGATGTGKTKTLQVLAEQLSALGVPVFAADVKGDLAGMSRPGEANEKVAARVSDLGVEWDPAGFPVSFLSLGGLGPGVPVRATVSAFGPQLLGKVLDANETQSSSLSLVFRYADEAGLPLLDLVDLAEVLKFLTSDEGKAELKGIGGLSSQVAQTVRLIRSKGVGVFFVTQLPDDVPEEVLAQLGNRIQHALRAFTPRDAKALKAAVTTYPKTADYDLEEDLTQLGTGEAMVTILSERGAPTPVVWTRLCPPRSLMAAIEAEGVTKAAEADPLWARYSAEIDRESAREKLAARLAGATEAAPQSVEDLELPPPPPPEPTAPRRRRRQESSGNVVVDYLKTREGRAMVNTVTRGVFSLLRKRR